MFIDVKEAAHLMRVSEKTVYRWLTAETIPHVRFGEQYRFSRDELMAWASAAGRPLAPDALLSDAEDDGPLPSVSDLLSRGGIYYRIGGRTPEEAIGVLDDDSRVGRPVLPCGR